MCGKAPTGSGKTLAFGIGAVARLKGKGSRPKHPRVLVLTPTRELAAQVASELQVLADPRGLRVDSFYGGVGYGPQLKALSRGVDVAVACPGRLGDLLERGSIRLDAVEIVVIDEADRMADMGFLPDVRRILDLTPDGRQTLLFSATLDGDIDVLVKRYQNDPARHELEVDEDDASAAVHLFWRVVLGRPGRADRRGRRGQRARPSCSPAPSTAPTGSPASSSSGGSGPRPSTATAARSSARRRWTRSSAGAVDALVATDVAARGIHVDGVNAVVHFDPSGRPQGLRPPLGPHGPGRGHRRGRQLRHPGQGGCGQEAPARAAACPIGTTEPDLSAIADVIGPPPPRRVVKERPADRDREPSPNANRGGVRASRPFKARKPGGRPAADRRPPRQRRWPRSGEPR